jgi:hypothetical protein
MGIIRQGILGGFRKKAGTVIGARWRGLDVIRGLPAKSEKEATQEQLDQRFKFGLVTSMLSWISDVIDVGYRSATQVPTPMNKAVSHNLLKAITGVSPNFNLDPLKLSFSTGKITIPKDYEATSVLGGTLDITWSNEPADKHTHANDQVTLVVYSPVKQKFVKVVNAGMRSELEYSIQLPLNWVDDTVHTYMVLSADKSVGKACSETVYIGQNIVL